MEQTLFLCRAQEAQMDAAVEMIEMGRAYLKSQGIDQWQNGYPNQSSIEQDIAAEKGFFLTDGTELFAYLCMDMDGEPAYNNIKGNWLTDQDAKYLVIHRLAFNEKFRGQGFSSAVFKLAEDFCIEHQIHSIRVDTDGDNKIMQHVMTKAGYTYCGTIWFAGSDKVAFEKIIA